MIHVYYGDGAGKTTAAMGLALRAHGQGLRVGIAQFLKDDQSGERRVWQQLPGAILFPAPQRLPFTRDMSDEDRREYAAFLEDLQQQLIAALPRLDLLVLDEWGDAAEQGWFAREQIDALLAAAGDTELVVTTHALPKWLREQADYLTEMRSERHPFELGVVARRGIEY